MKENKRNERVFRNKYVIMNKTKINIIIINVRTFTY